jgi:hypothetical protein
VQCTEYKKARFSCRKGERNCFQVAHFADKHNISVLPQRRLEPSGKRAGISRDFPLSYGAFFVLVHELDRFLNRHHVFCKVLIDVVDQRSLRSSFAGAGRTSD